MKKRRTKINPNEPSTELIESTSSNSHFVLPDCQVKPGTPIDHLAWAGRFCAKKKPNTIVCIGDFADMHSLSSYDVGKKSFEGRTYKADIDYAKEAMELFISPLRAERERLRRSKRKEWNPRLVLCIGNHEQRIITAINSDRKLDGLISTSDLGYSEMGWEVVPFLKVKVLDGIAYSHYITSGPYGKPVSSARAMLTKGHMSCVMGHVQKRDIAYDKRADGTQITGIFSGIYYQHDEEYLNPQTNACWRGVWMLHNVKDGAFDECPIPLSYLRSKYA